MRAGPPCSTGLYALARLLATNDLCTSSAPSAMRIWRAITYELASGRSIDQPSAPCTWMARSITSWSTRAPQNLSSAISTRAFDAPWLSHSHALCSAMRRSARMSADDSAIISWIICFSMSSSPLVSRLIARSHIMSNAASHWPTHRIAWWMRPPFRRFCASTKPSPSSPTRFATGTRQSRRKISA